MNYTAYNRVQDAADVYMAAVDVAVIRAHRRLYQMDDKLAMEISDELFAAVNAAGKKFTEDAGGADDE